MKEFKFLKTNTVSRDMDINGEETVNAAVYYRNSTRYNDISPDAMVQIKRTMRQSLIEHLWESGMVRQEIVYEGEDGFTLVTELNV